MVNAAICLHGESKLVEATTLLDKALAIDAKNKLAYQTLAEIYQDQKKPDLAAGQYQKILAFDPKDENTLLALAMNYESRNKQDAELGIYRKLHEIDPKNSNYAIWPARYYDKQGKLDMAIEEARKLVAADPKSPAYRMTLADFLVKKPDYPGAMEQYTEMSKSDDVYVKSSALTQMGDLQEKQAKHDDATASYKKAVQAKPSNTRALDALAKSYADSKKTDEYLAYLKSLIEPATQDLPYRYFVDAYKNAGKTDEAVTTLEAAAAKKPDNPPLESALAEAYTAVKQNDKAIDIYKKMLAKSADDPQTNRSLGDLYKSMGRDQDA